MVTPYQNRETVDRGAVHETRQLNPNVVYNVSSNAEGLNTLVSTLDGFLGKVSHQLDKQTVRKAQKAGSIAGLSDSFKEMEGDTLAAESYNKAGLEIFVNRKLSEVSTGIQKIAVDPRYRNDPVAMQHALEDYKEQYIKDVPTSALADFSVAFDDRMGRALQSANANQVRMTISRNAAQFLETETVLLAEITNAARAGDEQAIAQARTEYFSALDRQNGLSLMPEEVAKKKIGIQRQIQKDAVIGEFLRTSPEKRPAFASAFIEDNPLTELLTADEIDGLKRDMITAWQVDDNLKDAAERENKLMQENTVNDALATFHMDPSPANYAALVSMEGIEPNTIKAARTYLTQNIDKPDPIVDYTINQLIMGGEYEAAKTMLNDPQYFSSLPRKTVQKYRKDLADIEDGGGFEDLDSYKEVQRRIKSDFKNQSLYGDNLSEAGASIQRQIYDDLKSKYPKYLAGEIPFEDVDPMRMYNLKKSNYKKNDIGDETVGVELNTKTNGKVIIPKKYLDNPAQYMEDRKIGLPPALNSPEVMEYMADKITDKELENTKGNNNE